MSSHKLRFRDSKSRVAPRFAALIKNTHCPYATEANISFASGWNRKLTTEENILALLPEFDNFIEYGQEEGADMFVIEVRDRKYIKNTRTFATLLRSILHTLHQLDPTSDGNLTDNITSMEWDFTYRHVRFFVPTFAPFYDSSHARYSHQKESAFIVFQPDRSFDRHGISSKNSNRQKITETVRMLFEKGGVTYDLNLVAGSIKAIRYIKPYLPGGSPIRWWEDDGL
jgi:hypothetical protein